MNNLANIGSLIQSIKNPQDFLQSAMNNNQIMSNPMAKNALEMYQSGNMDGLREMAENLCKEKGTTVDNVKNSLMSQFGIK